MGVGLNSPSGLEKFFAVMTTLALFLECEAADFQPTIYIIGPTILI